MSSNKKKGFFSWLKIGKKSDDSQTQEIEQSVVETQENTIDTQQVDETTAELDYVSDETVSDIEDKIDTEHSSQDKLDESLVNNTQEVTVETNTINVISEPVEELPNIQVENSVSSAYTASDNALNPALKSDIAIETERLQSTDEIADTNDVIDSIQDSMINDTETVAVNIDLQQIDVTTEPEQLEEEAKVVAEEVPVAKKGFFARLKESLIKTKQNIGSGFLSLFTGKKIDDELFEELEEQLLIADVGVETTNRIIKQLTEHASRNELKDATLLYDKLKEEMAEILSKVSQPLDIQSHKPFVILMVGVNGVGKTTTIGKLAKQFQAQGKSVMLAAGDTFRAAAVEQLQVWGERNNIPVVAQHTGADSASVIFDALESAKARQVDVLIADTAGRLQNKSHLMDELKKIVRVMKKQDPESPHEIMLTLDACTGQNAISQAKIFNEAVGLTGITLTKLDGTAKGGVIFALADQFNIPVRYIGVGEKIDDLRPFNSIEFVEALFDK